MSGFDVMMRSDELIQRDRQFYDAQRFAADRQTADIVANIPLQALNANLQAKRAESDMRLQEAVIEEQFHRNKLARMRELDESDLMREQVVAARLANETMRKRLKTDDQKSVDAHRERFTKLYSEHPEIYHRHGIRGEPGKDGYLKMGRIPEGERSKYPTDNMIQGRLQAAEARRQESHQLQSLKAAAEAAEESGDYQRAEEIRRAIAGMAPQSQLDQQPKAKEDPLASEKADLSLRFQRSQAVSGGGAYVEPGRMAEAFYANREKLRSMWRNSIKKVPRAKDLSDEMIDKELMDLLSSSSPEMLEQRQGLINYIMGSDK